MIGLGGQSAIGSGKSLYLLRLEQVSNQWREGEAGLNRFNLCSYPEECVLSMDWTSIRPAGGAFSHIYTSARTQYPDLCSGLWSRMNSLSVLGQLGEIVVTFGKGIPAPGHILMFGHVSSLSYPDAIHWGLWCVADAPHVLSWVKVTVNTLCQTGHQLLSPGSKLCG